MDPQKLKEIHMSDLSRKILRVKVKYIIINHEIGYRIALLIVVSKELIIFYGVNVKDEFEIFSILNNAFRL